MITPPFPPIAMRPPIPMRNYISLMLSKCWEQKLRPNSSKTHPSYWFYSVGSLELERLLTKFSCNESVNIAACLFLVEQGNHWFLCSYICRRHFLISVRKKWKRIFQLCNQNRTGKAFVHACIGIDFSTVLWMQVNFLWIRHSQSFSFKLQ